MTNHAIFLDRDGTLNEEDGHIASPEQFRLYSFAAESVRLINQSGWKATVRRPIASIAIAGNPSPVWSRGRPGISI